MINHVKHQNMPASLLPQHSCTSNGLLTSPKLLYCEKCGFVTTRTEDFESHMREHLTHFHCNHVAYSKKELEVHLLQHKFPFRCQYCGQGYMRREHLQNHVERLQKKDVGPKFIDAQTTLPESISLSTAFAHRVQRANVPTVKVRIPVPVTRNDEVNKSKRHHKLADFNVLNTPKVSTELISPVKNLVQHNMALTVPLPEEVSIPAGCMVELIEVKTVNGTKELKLRLVSQQQKKSVLDDTVVTSVNPLSSNLKHQNLSGNAEKSSVNRRICMAKNINVKRPATFQTIVDKTALNGIHGVMSGTKRTLQESMVRNVEIPCALPTKIARMTNYPSRPGMTGPKIQAEALKPKTDHPLPVTTDNTAKKITGAANQLSKEVVSSCKTERENNIFVEHPRIPSELQVAVKEEPNDISNKRATPEIKEEPLKQNEETVLNTTSSPISFTHASKSTQMFKCKSECKMQKVGLDSTILMTMLKRPGSVVIDPLSTKQTKMEDSLQKSSILSEPFEPFPIISSVFSLSQQQGEIQSSIRPLVKALRGIVMSKDSPSVQVSTDHTETTGAETEHKEEVLTINCTQEGKKYNAASGPRLLSQESYERKEKCSQQTQTQAQKYYIKEESSSSTGTDNNQKGPQEAGINNILNGSLGRVDGQCPMTQSACKKKDSSSKFLTVSLERMHMGLWKPSHKSPIISENKPCPPIQRFCHQAFLYPAPLKVGQLVIRPGPNQPVVVLNHPKPAVPKRTDLDHLAESQVSAEGLPKCQILKMRLSKVMGGKYEVIGCTVGFFS